MLVGGAILPHPPIVLPDFAPQRGAELDATVAAIRAACRWIADALRPDRLVVSSPHVGHGFEVPLFFVAEALGRRLPFAAVLTDEPSYAHYRALGERLRATETDAERVGLIASGDLSHRLSDDSPYGFHPSGPLLDALIRRGVEDGDVDALLAIDPLVLEEGAECGLRSVVFALAALQPARTEVLSYEGPYGVGYLVATLAPRDRANPS